MRQWTSSLLPRRVYSRLRRASSDVTLRIQEELRRRGQRLLLVQVKMSICAKLKPASGCAQWLLTKREVVPCEASQAHRAYRPQHHEGFFHTS